MKTNIYLPEGERYCTSENREYLSSAAGIEKAMREGAILEGIVTRCDGSLNLHVDLCGLHGIIPRSECVWSPNGENVKDIAIITRVGKAAAFKVVSVDCGGREPRIVLSRRQAQMECNSSYLAGLACGDIIPARVTHLENFGAFVDIGCGIVSLLPVDCISVSRISHPRDRLLCGMRIYAVVKTIDSENRRITVSQRELFGTWEENVKGFEPGQTVAGIVRSVESYGIFVELTPNLAGLAELREGVKVGQCAAVYIKSIIPDKMKIKLVLIDSHDSVASIPSPDYYVDVGSVRHIDRWQYSPDGAVKCIESVFD